MKEVYIILTRYIYDEYCGINTDFANLLISPEVCVYDNKKCYFQKEEAEKLVEKYLYFNKKYNHEVKRFYIIEKYLTTD